LEHPRFELEWNLSFHFVPTPPTATTNTQTRNGPYTGSLQEELKDIEQNSVAQNSGPGTTAGTGPLQAGTLRIPRWTGFLLIARDALDEKNLRRRPGYPGLLLIQSNFN
jgi:hypothetical protein